MKKKIVILLVLSLLNLVVFAMVFKADNHYTKNSEFKNQFHFSGYKNEMQKVVQHDLLIEVFM